MSLRRRLAETIVRAAATRLRRRHPEWADALTSEQEHLSGTEGELAWAIGSLRTALALADPYPLVLAAAVTAMIVYQWSADESLVTLGVMAALCMLLGGLRPPRFLLSGVMLGAVVAAVNAFETLTGLRPAYEIYNHTWAHDLRWLVLLPPAVVSSALGRAAGLTHPEPF